MCFRISHDYDIASEISFRYQETTAVWIFLDPYTFEYYECSLFLNLQNIITDIHNMGDQDVGFFNTIKGSTQWMNNDSVRLELTESRLNKFFYNIVKRLAAQILK